MNPIVPAPPKNRELYIDAFRGLMALVMVQGHVFDSLLSPEARAVPLYQWQVLFHGSTAPGFLFASGFVAGLPRAPLSLTASVRRARRLLFVLGVGYALHLPYFSVWKTALEATPAQRAALFACDALQVIAVSQLFVLLLQWPFGRGWPKAAGGLAVLVAASAPFVWAARWSAGLPAFLAPYLDASTGSTFPVFPHAAFVLAGAAAGAAIGRQDPARRHRRMVATGLGLLAAGTILTPILEGWCDFWLVSPAYVLLRMGGLLLILRAVAAAAPLSGPMGILALLGHETLNVYVLHLLLLFGGVVWTGPLVPLAGTLSFTGAFVVLVLMLPVLFTAAFLWHRLKVRAPHQAQRALVLLSAWFVLEFLIRPW